MKAKALTLTRPLFPFRRQRQRDAVLQSLTPIPVPASAVSALDSAEAFRETLLARIGGAQRRIWICALYLQDDVAGREILDALYAAKRARPELEIRVFVDWHRAQRGLIGKAKSPGNAGFYREIAAREGLDLPIYGVPVQNRELFGVLHLKGFVIDDALIYSGASLNEVYLARHGRYRLDRYHVFEHAGLADSFVAYLQTGFLSQPAVNRLDREPVPSTRQLQGAIRQFREHLQSVRYAYAGSDLGPGDVAVTPLVGFGRQSNPLNTYLLALMRSAERRLVVFTPYFNLPGPLRNAIGHVLKRGGEVVIVVGDKTANDFFIPPEQPFKTIGLLPYLYETNLRRFAKTNRAAMADGRLHIHLWQHGDNSYHAKGLFVDEHTAVVTGNNLNPRAWSLDLENGLVIRDPNGLLKDKHAVELQRLLKNTRRLNDYQELETPRHYPEPVRKTLKRLKRVRLDHLLNRIL